MRYHGPLVTLVLAGLLWAAPALASAVVARPASPALSKPSSATEDIRDVRGPVPVPLWWRWLALGGGAALLAGLAGATVVVLRRRRAKPLAPHERALLRLEQARPLAAAGQVRAYAGAASDAVREYIEERFSMRAAHSTTEEFFDDLVVHASAPLGAHRGALVKFLGACDLAKFARLPLPREEMVSLNDLARRFVLDTAPTTPASQPTAVRTP